MEIKGLRCNTQYDSSQVKHEVISKKSIVDAAGYISPKQRITNLLRAGERLDQYRRELYDYADPSADDGVYMDEMRTPGLDLSDVSRIQERALERLRAKSRSDRSRPLDQENAEAKSETKSDAGLDNKDNPGAKE